MVKVQAPALSLDASGAIGGCIVFSKWKGRAYARALVKPHNPKSAGQTGIRAMLSWLSQQWVELSAPNQATWDELAAATNISPFNAYVAYNVRRWRENRGPSKQHPAAQVGTAVTIGQVGTGGARSASIVNTPSAATLGWGMAIFRKAVTGVALVYNNLVKIVAIDGVNPVTWIDAPLDAGHQFYASCFVCTDGSLGALCAEDDCTIT